MNLTEPLPTGTTLGVSARIRAAEPHLSQSMARIAQFLTENPEAVLNLSINELAARASTSAATVTRFCQLLGYAGYPTLRMSAAADLGRSSSAESWTREAGQTFDPDNSATQIVRDLLGAQLSVLQTAVDLLDVEAVDRVATSISGSPHVDVYGVGGSGVMAVSLQQRLYRVGVNAHVWTEAHLGLASAALLHEGCVAIALSNSGQTSETLELISLARERGAFTVALTSDPLSPVAEAAEVHIQTCPSGTFLNPGELAAQSAQQFVINLLYLLVARCDHDRAERALSLTSSAVLAHRPDLQRKLRQQARG